MKSYVFGKRIVSSFSLVRFIFMVAFFLISNSLHAETCNRNVFLWGGIRLKKPLDNYYFGVSTFNAREAQAVEVESVPVSSLPASLQAKASSTSVSATLSNVSWRAFIRTKSGRKYSVNITGPSSVTCGKPIGLSIANNGCAEKGQCPEYPDLDFSKIPIAQLVIQPVVPLPTGSSNPPPFKVQVKAFNARNHQSLYITHYNLSSNPLKSVKIRAKFVNESSTMYAMTSFAGGYAGFSHSAGLNTGYKLSIWNNCDQNDSFASNYCFRKGRDYRSQFVSINTADGFFPKSVPQDGSLDQNFRSIRNEKFPLVESSIYEFILDVSKTQEPFYATNYDGSQPVLVRINDAREVWTFYSFQINEITSQGVIIRHPFGTIARFGGTNITAVRSFMEAVGNKYNYRARSMTILGSRVKLEGQTTYTAVDLSKAPLNLNDFTDYTGMATYSPAAGTLSVTTGGAVGRPWGDLDGDGRVTIADAQKAFKLPSSQLDLFYGDVNRDGVVNDIDAHIISTLSAGGATSACIVCNINYLE